MNTTARKLGITLLTAVTAFAPLTASVANAGDRHWKRQYYSSHDDRQRFYNHREYSERNQYRQRHVYRHHRNNDAIALGIIGLGVGAIIGSALANSHNQPRVIYRPAPAHRDYYPAAPRTVHSGGRFEPWTRSWFRYCENKYRSFNASTGTYRGYDGRDHFCVVR